MWFLGPFSGFWYGRCHRIDGRLGSVWGGYVRILNDLADMPHATQACLVYEQHEKPTPCQNSQRMRTECYEEVQNYD